MTFAFVLAELASELALFAAAGFLLFAIDDLAVDLIYFARRLWRAVTVYSRSEDADMVCRTVVGGGVNVDVSVERVPNDRANPSSRRQGLVISFMCENCSDEARSDLELCLAQHKGCTFAFWRFEGGP